MFIEYLLKASPGLVLGSVLILFFRKKSEMVVLFTLIMLFIYTRDLMTPLKLWSIGEEGFIWLRFNNNPLYLILLSILSLSMVGGTLFLLPNLKKSIVWIGKSRVKSIFTGILGAILVVTPFILFSLSTPLESRGGTVLVTLLPFTLLLALTGNFFEEILFRGYFQGFLTDSLKVNPYISGVISGVLFSYGHIFLAFNVTEVGIPVLIFSLWEGIICGLLRARYGLISAVLTHGLAIFILTGGFI